MRRRAKTKATHARGAAGRAAFALCAALPLLALALSLTTAKGQRPEGVGGGSPFGGGRPPGGGSPSGGRTPFGGGPPRQRPPDSLTSDGPARSAAPAGPAGEFTFTRTIYRSPYSYGRRWGGAWATDFPEADDHFSVGIREWAGTNLNVSQRPVQVEIMDERLFDYPLIYIVEPGYMELNDEEAARLREYVARGGFMFFDDFWGEAEWANVLEQMKKVFPDLEPKELPLTHPVFHSYLDIEEVVQVPNIYNAQRGVTSEKGG